MDRDEMIVDNLKLVHSLANKYRVITNVNYDDMFQEGVIGLIKAVDGFDPDRGCKFSTYAYQLIRRNIQNCVKRNMKHNGVVHDSEKWTIEDVEDSVKDNSVIEVIKGEIDKLIGDRRRIIVELYLNNKSIEEVADKFKISTRYAYTLRNDALKLLGLRLKRRKGGLSE